MNPGLASWARSLAQLHSCGLIRPDFGSLEKSSVYWTEVRSRSEAHFIKERDKLFPRERSWLVLHIGPVPDGPADRLLRSLARFFFSLTMDVSLSNLVHAAIAIDVGLPVMNGLELSEDTRSLWLFAPFHSDYRA
jgi:hypothetical protein